jgi:uncharacterized protein YbjQ (UPF0145 family)
MCNEQKFFASFFQKRRCFLPFLRNMAFPAGHRRTWPSAATIITLSLSSCASGAPAGNLSADQEAAKVIIMTGTPAHIVKLGALHGYACSSVVLDAAKARGRAMEQAKYQAYLMGGNAITGFSCAVVETTEKCPDCWLCAQCNGTAAKMAAPAG